MIEVHRDDCNSAGSHTLQAMGPRPAGVGDKTWHRDYITPNHHTRTHCSTRNEDSNQHKQAPHAGYMELTGCTYCGTAWADGD